MLQNPTKASFVIFDGIFRLLTYTCIMSEQRVSYNAKDVGISAPTPSPHATRIAAKILEAGDSAAIPIDLTESPHDRELFHSSRAFPELSHVVQRFR